ncbi:MAG: DEAD/DEAH box helicase, partial [Myxococcota bacterium]
TEIDASKHDALRDFFMDLPPDEPVAMFARFIHDLDVIHRAASAAGRTSVELSGRRKELDEWQRAGAQPTILAAQIQTGGLGVDMTRARYCGFFSLGFSLGDYEQALARTHRQGQTRNVTYVHFISKETVDRRVYGALDRKERVVHAVLEGWK